MPGGLSGLLPASEEGVYFFLAVVTLVHLGVATSIQVFSYDWASFEAQLINRIFDAITFASSLTLLLALMDKELFRALGDTKPFLFTGGMLGFLFSAFALRPRKSRR